LKIRNKEDFASGLMFIAFGAFFAILARGYQMGTPAKMGSGYFPFWLGVVLVLLGLFVLIKSFAAEMEDNKFEKWDWKTLLWITGSVLIFAIVLNYIGLILSILVLVFVSAYASHEFNWKQTLISSIILIGICYVAFVWGLKLQFPVWPPFLTN
jgi:small-conductance mechanosensitive channel